MKRRKKKELIAIIETLAEANEYVRVNARTKGQSVVDILAQCQEAAVEIGNCIEMDGEIGEPLVRILEEYCEKIYQISLALTDEKQIRGLVEEIQQQLVVLKNRIQSDLPTDKVEIVFFPYKSSMWDSLESVWKAAVEGLCSTNSLF